MVRRAGRDTFGHDRDGRVVFRRRKRLSQAAAVWRFEWDGEDRLVGLVTPDGDRWRYLYDGVGRRVAKQRFGSDGAVDSQVWFVWDGFQVVEELSFGGEGRVERASSWCWDPVSGVPVSQVDMLARVGDTGSQEWFDRRFYSIVSDLVGAASELIGEDGTLAWAPARSVWGEDRDGGSQGAVQCPWGFAGQYSDEESGFRYNVHRFYDPATGGFLSPDPVGVFGGLNPHASVPNPTGWVDPLGLTPCSPQPSNPNTPSGLSPSSIRFSQSSVNNVDEIAGSMRANGWVGDPIDVVRMPDGSLATPDNTRVLAAHQAGIDVQATVRAFDDPLTTEMAERFATAKGGMPSTWGEAITNRIGNQNAGYRTAWPDGSPFTGWSGN
jgi:RHS repeat-associated protein